MKLLCDPTWISASSPSSSFFSPSSSLLPTRILASIHTAGISSGIGTESVKVMPTSSPLENVNSLFSPSFPFTSNSISAKYPEPLTLSPIIGIIISTRTVSLAGFRRHMTVGISSPFISPSFTLLTFITAGSKDRSNCAAVRSVTLSTPMVTTKVAPSSTYSGALTSTMTGLGG